MIRRFFFLAPAFLALLLTTATPARAEKTRYVPVGGDISVRLKFGEVTRVVFPAPIEKVLPASRELSIKPDGASLYITPLAPDADRVLWVTAGGRVHAVRVSEGSPPDETVVLVSLESQTPPPSRLNAVGSASSPVACLLRDLAGGRSCPGATRKRTSKKIYEDAFMEIEARETLSMGYLLAVKAVVSNRLPTALRLDARRFEFNGAVAVAVEPRWLQPGKNGRALLYVVIDRRL